MEHTKILAPLCYSPRQAAYDLKKLRGNQMVERIGKTRHYQATPAGLKTIAAVVVLRGESHPSEVGHCPGDPPVPRLTKSDGARPSLRNRADRHGGHLPGTRSSRQMIDKKVCRASPLRA